MWVCLWRRVSRWHLWSERPGRVDCVPQPHLPGSTPGRVPSPPPRCPLHLTQMEDEFGRIRLTLAVVGSIPCSSLNRKLARSESNPLCLTFIQISFHGISGAAISALSGLGIFSLFTSTVVISSIKKVYTNFKVSPGGQRFASFILLIAGKKSPEK